MRKIGDKVKVKEKESKIFYGTIIKIQKHTIICEIEKDIYYYNCRRQDDFESSFIMPTQEQIDLYYNYLNYGKRNHYQWSSLCKERR